MENLELIAKPPPPNPTRPFLEQLVDEPVNAGRRGSSRRHSGGVGRGQGSSSFPVGWQWTSVGWCMSAITGTTAFNSFSFSRMIPPKLYTLLTSKLRFSFEFLPLCCCYLNTFCDYFSFSAYSISLYVAS